jgi:hypothetical protein
LVEGARYSLASRAIFCVFRFDQLFLSLPFRYFIYIRHDLRYAGLLVLFILPVALAANSFPCAYSYPFLTHHAGEDLRRGSFFTTLRYLLFALALLVIFAWMTD